jgi:transposase InsO family protein
MLYSCWRALSFQSNGYIRIYKTIRTNHTSSANCHAFADNGIGPYVTTAETRVFAKELGLKPVTTPLTNSQSNGMAESFVKTLKRYYAKLANGPDSKSLMAQLKDWFDDYNSYHPHSALGYLPPTLFRKKRSVT